jgi:hypothetical protein
VIVSMTTDRPSARRAGPPQRDGGRDRDRQAERHGCQCDTFGLAAAGNEGEQHGRHRNDERQHQQDTAPRRRRAQNQGWIRHRDLTELVQHAPTSPVQGECSARAP